MVKYFIERPDGKWLADPDNHCETWTRNPLKAWDQGYLPVGTPPKGSSRGDRVVNYTSLSFINTHAGAEYKITEHEFIDGPLFTEDFKGDGILAYGDNYLMIKNSQISRGTHIVVSKSNVTIENCNLTRTDLSLDI